jgi:hypothetical protein
LARLIQSLQNSFVQLENQFNNISTEAWLPDFTSPVDLGNYVDQEFTAPVDCYITIESHTWGGGNQAIYINDIWVGGNAN